MVMRETVHARRTALVCVWHARSRTTARRRSAIRKPGAGLDRQPRTRANTAMMAVRVPAIWKEF